jgi:hypothetical protein
MQTQATVEKKSDQATKAANKTVQNRVVSKKPSVRTTELNKMIELVLKDPDSVSQQEFILLQSSIGFQQALKLMQEGKQRKRVQTGKQPDKKTENITTPKKAEEVKTESNATKEATKTSSQKTDKTVIQKKTAKPEQAVKKAESSDTKPKAQIAENKTNVQAKTYRAKPQSNLKNVEIADMDKHVQKNQKAVSANPAVKEAKANKEQKKQMEAPTKGEAVTAPKAVAPKAKKTVEAQTVQETKKPQVEYKQPASASSTVQQGTATAKGGAGAAAAKSNGAANAPAKSNVKIKGEDPGSVLQQLGSLPPTEIVNAYSQATAVFKGALEKQRQKAQAVLPQIPTPTGLAPGKAPASAANKVNVTSHKTVSDFKSQKSGGAAQEGTLKDFNLKTDKDTDADDVMSEARACAADAPEIGMTGEADPSQLEGFKSEAAQNVQTAKQTELAETSKDFGESSILPKEDNTKLKTQMQLGAVTPIGLDMKQMAAVRPDVAARANPVLSSKLQSFMSGKSNEYQKGKGDFDSGLIAQKASTDKQIENEKTQAREKQLKEQQNVKSEVAGYRDQWRSEIETATSQYDKEAGAEAEGKKQEIGNIKKEKEDQVKVKLSDAEKDAAKECNTAKKDADKEKQEGEKKNKNWFEKAVDWGKEKIQQGIDLVKKAVSFIFDKLKSAVKFIFEKAKQAATALIEAGRKLIVNAIKGLGAILKKLVTTVFAKFPGISKKICGMIDGAVNRAVNAVNKAAEVLKKGVTAALDLMAKGVDKLLSGVQALYRAILGGIQKFLSMDFMQILDKVLEAAEIAAEIALAIATGGGSVLMQIVTWLATTLPKLLNLARGVIDFVNTIRGIKFSDIKQLLNPAGIGNFLVKGLFGELNALPQADSGDKEENEDKEPASGGEATGLMKVLAVVSKVFKTLKKVYGKVAGVINKVLPKINITGKSWFEPFSMIYAGVVKALEVAKNPAEALNEGAAKLKEAAGTFFGGIKEKIMETAGNIKQKLAILGQPAQMLKLIANKAVDMVLNFIITHPPSALVKAVFKGIEAVAGKSIVELVRQYIPFADKIFDKIAESQPVQTLMKPLEGPVKAVGGAIDQVTTGATGMVKDAEGKTLSVFGSGAKILSGLAGVQGSAAGKDGGKKAGPGGNAGGGDFFGTIKGGIHTHLMNFGQKLLQKGKSLVVAGIGKVKGLLTPKVKFKLGKESHELWVEKGKDKGKNVVMMASGKPGPIENNKDAERILENNRELNNKKNNAENPGKEKSAPSNINELAVGLEKKGSAGVSNVEYTRMKTIIKVTKFKCKAKFDKAEYERQLNNQQDGLNKLTIDEFLQNRDKYKKYGRAKEGNEAQRKAREEALADKIEELLEADDSLSESNARDQALKWMETQAALHDPDQIAGGKADKITGMGDKSINSSIGSQWKSRAVEMEDHILRYAKDNKLSNEEKEHTYLNINLSC